MNNLLRSGNFRFALVIAFGMFLAGCSVEYDACLQRDIKGDISGAWEACSAAVSVAPDSKSGKAAAVKLVEMRPRYDAWKIKRDEELAAQQAEAERAEANRIASMRRKVSRALTYGDDYCTNYGLPPVEYKYSGGTIAENKEVALADGCVRSGTDLDNWFCCKHGYLPGD